MVHKHVFRPRIHISGMVDFESPDAAQNMIQVPSLQILTSFRRYGDEKKILLPFIPEWKSRVTKRCSKKCGILGCDTGYDFKTGSGP